MFSVHLLFVILLQYEHRLLKFLIVNEDRHFNNFGVIRNTETLEWKGAAPIFDSGTSLWHDKPHSLIYPLGKFTCKPFKNDHEEQIKLVTDLDWLDLKSLDGIDDVFRDVVKDSLFIDKERTYAIIDAFTSRIKMLKSYVNVRSKRQSFAGHDTKHDVKKDIKYSGSKKKRDKNNDLEL